MVRFVIGIIFVSLGTLTILNPKNSNDMAIGILLVWIIPGILLIYYGRRFINKRKNILKSAFTMLRESNHIDTSKLALNSGLNEYKVREIIAKAQSKGIISLHANIDAPAQTISNEIQPTTLEKDETGHVENTSGQGRLAVIPREIQKWNWGAFLMTWIWGIANKTYIPLLVAIPIVGLVVPFICGAKGNEWAWKNKRWDSIEDFKRNQRRWIYWGIFLWMIVIILLVMSQLLNS